MNLIPLGPVGNVGNIFNNPAEAVDVPIPEYEPRVVIGDTPFSIRHASHGTHQRLSLAGVEDQDLEPVFSPTDFSNVEEEMGDPSIERHKAETVGWLHDFSKFELFVGIAMVIAVCVVQGLLWLTWIEMAQSSIDGVAEVYLRTVSNLEKVVVDDILAMPQAAVNFTLGAVNRGEVAGLAGVALSSEEENKIIEYQLEILRNDPRIGFLGIQVGTTESLFYAVERASFSGEPDVPLRAWRPGTCTTAQGSVSKAADVYLITAGKVETLTSTPILTLTPTLTLTLEGTLRCYYKSQHHLPIRPDR